MHIPRFKKQLFDVPVGRYQSKVVSMYNVPGKGECDNLVKILFAPLGMERKLEQSVVACEYCIDEPNERLVDDLNTILSGKFEEHIDDRGDFSNAAVKDRLVDIVVKGYHKGDHERPYTFVASVLPPNTLKLN